MWGGAVTDRCPGEGESKQREAQDLDLVLQELRSGNTWESRPKGQGLESSLGEQDSDIIWLVLPFLLWDWLCGYREMGAVAGCEDHCAPMPATVLITDLSMSLCVFSLFGFHSPHIRNTADVHSMGSGNLVLWPHTPAQRFLGSALV
jgi:hypothetical protein